MSNLTVFSSFNELLAHGNANFIPLNKNTCVTNSPPPIDVHESIEGKSFPNLIDDLNGFRQDIEKNNKKQKEHPDDLDELARSATTLKENRHDLLNSVRIALPELFTEIKYARENEPNRLPYLKKDYSKFAKACEDVMKLDKELHNNIELQELLLKIPELITEINNQ